MSEHGSEHAFIIINPKAKNGTAGKEWPKLEELIREEYHAEFHAELTKAPLHAMELTRQALREGYNLIVALGGDGLINEVVNGFYENGIPLNPQATLGVLSYATAADFVKTSGIPTDFRKAVKLLNAPSTKSCDLGLISCVGLDGEPIARYFINIAEFGVGAKVVDRVNKTTKRFGGKASFTWSILRTMLFYQNKNIIYNIDEGAETRSVMSDLVVANGRFYGAGLQPAPDAKIDDGLFDIIIIGDIGFFDAARNLGRLRDGTYLTVPHVSFQRGRRVSARCVQDVLIEADGEVIGKLPATFEILPAAIRIRA
jgi:YegS/Rv2252/BmrU family lipid kinase